MKHAWKAVVFAMAQKHSKVWEHSVAPEKVIMKYYFKNVESWTVKMQYLMWGNFIYSPGFMRFTCRG